MALQIESFWKNLHVHFVAICCGLPFVLWILVLSPIRVQITKGWDSGNAVVDSGCGLDQLKDQARRSFKVQTGSCKAQYEYHSVFVFVFCFFFWGGGVSKRLFFLVYFK